MAAANNRCLNSCSLSFAAPWRPRTQRYSELMNLRCDVTTQMRRVKRNKDGQSARLFQRPSGSSSSSSKSAVRWKKFSPSPWRGSRSSRRTMAAGCCGTKKQKLNNSSSAPTCNGSSAVMNGMVSRPCSVALPEMCFFCFDVLYCHLYNLDPPKTPSFSNDA